MEELIKELKTEAENGNLEQVTAIAKDLRFTTGKINHHDKRTDSVVTPRQPLEDRGNIKIRIRDTANCIPESIQN